MLYFDNLSKFPQIKHFVGTRDSEVNLESFVTIRQVHGDKVLVVNKNTKNLEGDAMITNKRGLMLVVKVADCVPIMLFDPVKNAIGIAHAGWRGTLKKIAGKTVFKMKKEFGTDPGNLIIGIGPCICVKHYEVDEVVLPGGQSNSTG